ncbi:Uncharacterised protein [Mycobacteroides abscessus subsp. abscessus]|nr:Uncharacterised protein [Mycobacteroides abscessus subsp. abscessus]
MTVTPLNMLSALSVLSLTSGSSTTTTTCRCPSAVPPVSAGLICSRSASRSLPRIVLSLSYEVVR